MRSETSYVLEIYEKEYKRRGVLNYTKEQFLKSLDLYSFLFDSSGEADSFSDYSSCYGCLFNGLIKDRYSIYPVPIKVLYTSPCFFCPFSWEKHDNSFNHTCCICDCLDFPYSPYSMIFESGTLEDAESNIHKIVEIPTKKSFEDAFDKYGKLNIELYFKNYEKERF